MSKMKRIRHIFLGLVSLAAISFSGAASAKFYWVANGYGWDCNRYMNGANTNIKIFDNSGPQRCTQYAGGLSSGGVYTGAGGEYGQTLQATWADHIAPRGDDIVMDQINGEPTSKWIGVWSNFMWTGASRSRFGSNLFKDVGFTIRSFKFDLTLRRTTV